MQAVIISKKQSYFSGMQSELIIGGEGDRGGVAETPRVQDQPLNLDWHPVNALPKPLLPSAAQATIMLGFNSEAVA